MYISHLSLWTLFPNIYCYKVKLIGLSIHYDNTAVVVLLEGISTVNWNYFMDFSWFGALETKEALIKQGIQQQNLVIVVKKQNYMALTSVWSNSFGGPHILAGMTSTVAILVLGVNLVLQFISPFLSMVFTQMSFYFGLQQSMGRRATFSMKIIGENQRTRWFSRFRRWSMGYWRWL